MTYTQQSLASHESLIHIGRFHWLYDVMAVINMVVSFLLAVLFLTLVILGEVRFGLHFGAIAIDGNDNWIDMLRKLHPIVKLFAILIFLMGVVRCVRMLVIKATTEIMVTSDRIVFKRGLVARYVAEININRIEGISVLQTTMGRILGYGRILVRGMGVGEMILPPVSNPIAFRRAIEHARRQGERT